MPRTCKVCRHSDRVAIDTALVAAATPLRTLAAQFGLSPSALQRHRNAHLPAVLVKGRAEADLVGAQSVVAFVRALQARAATILEKAEAAGNLGSALGALRELRGIADLAMRAADRDAAYLPVADAEVLVEALSAVLDEFVPDDMRKAAGAKVSRLMQSATARATSRRSSGTSSAR